MNPVVYRAASTGDSSFFESMTDPNSSTLLQVTIEKNTVLHLALQFKKKKLSLWKTQLIEVQVLCMKQASKAILCYISGGAT